MVKPAHEQPVEQPKQDQYLFWKLFFRASGLALLIASALLLITALVIGAVLYQKATTVLSSGGYSVGSVVTTAQQARYAQPIASNGYKNILLLGLDSLESRPGSPALSDSIVVASLNVATNEVRVLSLPRDLWSSEYKTKINALYTYGMERNPNDPSEFPTQAISQLLNLPIHHTLVVSMDTVAEVIDGLGGIDVDVSRAFTDTQFPRPDVDVTTERDPAKLYKTVSFTIGMQHMDSERVLEYIRSRHAEGDEGTDNARSIRQQEVIHALIARLTDRSVMTNTSTLQALLSVYRQHFEQELPLSELFATAFSAIRVSKPPQVTFYTLPVYPQDENGLITHPTKPSKEYTNQWVYIIRDQSTFQSSVRTLLQP